MNKDTSETDTLINIGTGTEISIKEIAQLISDVVEYDGEIHWDTSKPNGALRRILDVSKVNALGWEAKLLLLKELKKLFVIWMSGMVNGVLWKMRLHYVIV